VTASSTSCAKYVGEWDGRPCDGSKTPVFTKIEYHLAALAPAISFFHPGQYLIGYHEVRLIPDSGLSEEIGRAVNKYSHKMVYW
jgi:hypothetical protein